MDHDILNLQILLIFLLFLITQKKNYPPISVSDEFKALFKNNIEDEKLETGNGSQGKHPKSPAISIETYTNR